MKNEKLTLITLFTFFFLLSASLFYLMIAKDIKVREDQVEKMQAPREAETPQLWPKVEIRTSR
jgi:hypothetical protein